MNQPPPQSFGQNPAAAAAQQHQQMRHHPQQPKVMGGGGGVASGGGAWQFPQCVNETLVQISAFVKLYGTTARAEKKNRERIRDEKELQKRIDSDLFCINVVDRRTSRLTPLQQLKLLGIVCTYFRKEVSKEQAVNRYQYFDLIFCGREGEVLLHEFRVSFVAKLIVLALQYPVYELFDDIAQWLSKIGSNKSKEYAEKLVGELVDHYIDVPVHYKMFAYVQPLNAHSLEFSAYFLVFSIPKAKPTEAMTESSLSVLFVEVIGRWLFDSFEPLMQTIVKHPQLAQEFANEKFDQLLLYDSSNEVSDDVHHLFHFAVTSLIVEWRRLFAGTKPKIPISSAHFLKEKNSEQSENPVSRAKIKKDRMTENGKNLLNSLNLNLL